MLKTNKIKEEKIVNHVGAILIARKPQRNTITNVGADASVCPNSTKKYQKIGRGTGHRAQEPAAITLVALVITVIILIILAGVSLNLALGQNGIFTKSKDAVDKYKDEAQKEQNTLENIYQDMIEDEPFVKPTFNPEEDINFNSDSAINADKYGQEVTGYDVAKDKVGCWRLFYQDNLCTYLISNNLIYKDEEKNGFIIEDCYKSVKKDDDNGVLKYQSGADVSTIGKRLNPKLINKKNKDNHDFFGAENTYENILATAWLTDQTQWTEYTNGNEDAEFAIGSPTIELFAASFDAAAEANKSEERTKIGTGLNVGEYGYTVTVAVNQLKPSYNKGIYNKGDVDDVSWWLASPGIYDGEFIGQTCVWDRPTRGYIYGEQSDYYDWPIRPIVCIQTPVFNEKYADSLRDE